MIGAQQNEQLDAIKEPRKFTEVAAAYDAGFRSARSCLDLLATDATG
jgi:hypothetical protein